MKASLQMALLLLVPFTVFPLLAICGASQTLWKAGMLISGFLLAFYILRVFLHIRRRSLLLMKNIIERMVKAQQQRADVTKSLRSAPKPGHILFAVAIGTIAATAAIAIVYVTKASPNWYPCIAAGWLASMASTLLHNNLQR